MGWYLLILVLAVHPRHRPPSLPVYLWNSTWDCFCVHTLLRDLPPQTNPQPPPTWLNCCMGKATGRAARGACTSVTPVLSPGVPTTWLMLDGCAVVVGGISGCSELLSTRFVCRRVLAWMHASCRRTCTLRALASAIAIAACVRVCMHACICMEHPRHSEAQPPSPARTHTLGRHPCNLPGRSGRPRPRRPPPPHPSGQGTEPPPSAAAQPLLQQLLLGGLPVRVFCWHPFYLG